MATFAMAVLALYLLLAEPFGVDEALSIGLISHSCAAGELERSLEDLVGAVDVEDILDEVFRRFCVGK